MPAYHTTCATNDGRIIKWEEAEHRFGGQKLKESACRLPRSVVSIRRQSNVICVMINAMSPKLPNDIEQFVVATPSGAVKVEGTNGTTFWVMTDEAMRARQYVLEGIEQADRVEVAPWKSDDIKAAGRRMKQDRTA